MKKAFGTAIPGGTVSFLVDHGDIQTDVVVIWAGNFNIGTAIRTKEDPQVPAIGVGLALTRALKGMELAPPVVKEIKRAFYRVAVEWRPVKKEKVRVPSAVENNVVAEKKNRLLSIARDLVDFWAAENARKPWQPMRGRSTVLHNKLTTLARYKA